MPEPASQPPSTRRPVEPLGLRSQQATVSASPTRQAGSSGGRASRSGMLFRVAGQLPLTTLLAWAWLAFAIEADNAVEAAGSEHLSRLFRISMAMWGNGLRLISEEGVTVGELQALSQGQVQYRRARAVGLDLGGRVSWQTPGGLWHPPRCDGRHGVTADPRRVVRPPAMAADHRHGRGEVASTVSGTNDPVFVRSTTAH